MSQLTIYLDTETREKARRAAKREGLSLSRWARNQLAAATERKNQWPEGYFQLSGSIHDESLQRPEELSSRQDLKRESL